MPTPTYIPLATVTLGSSASSVTFSSIPATFRDLVLTYTATGTAAAVVRGTLNGSTADGTNVAMFGSSGGTSSSTGVLIDLGTVDAAGNSVNICQFMDYSATDKHKTILTRSNRGAGSVVLAFATRWAQLVAVTSIAVQPASGSFLSGGTFNLYGIAS